MAITTINLSSLDGSNGFRLDGRLAFEGSGYSVSNAGDVNGDGFADVLVGAPVNSTNGPPFSGSSYVVFGKASGFDATLALSSLDGSNGFRLDSIETNSFTGISVSDAGDVNGDGFADVLVGTYGADPNGSLSGSSYVVFGKAAGFDATLDVSSLDGNNGFRLDGAAARDFSGMSVSSAGDINGDGFDDVLVGALFADPSGNDAGSSYVIFGKASSFDSTLNLSNLDGTNGFRLAGVAAVDRMKSVSNAGDVNGDGFADLIVGAYGADPNGNYDAGSSYVVFGKAAGFDATLELSSLDGSNGFRLNGTAAFDSSGRSVSNAGDVNGDGFADVIVGAPSASPNSNFAGSSYVVFGKAAGFAAEMNLSSLDGSDGFRVDGAAAYDSSGYSVSSAGDVNGDGFADLLIGAFTADPNGNYSGSNYVIFGKATGFSATLDLSNLDSNSGFRLDGAATYDNSGKSVSSAGDVNGDGFDDVLVGAPGASPNSPNNNYSGSSYVVFGGNFTDAVTALGTAGEDKLKGSKAVDRIVAGDGDDTLIGRGGADVFHGGAGDDTIEIRDVNFQLVDGGAGNDTLDLDRSHLDLDLIDVRGKIIDLEAIDMDGHGHNTLTLTALDVLNLSSTSNTLQVDGNNNDSVVGLDSGWSNGGVADGYHTFTNGEAVLLVGVQVATDFA